MLTEQGVEIHDGDRARVVRHADVEAVLAHENGLRHVVPTDGFAISVNPHAWRAGDAAVAQLDRAVPADRLLPMPAVDEIDVGVRASLWRRWSAPLRARQTGLVLVVLLVAAPVAWPAAARQRPTTSAEVGSPRSGDPTSRLTC